jgi:hypothetical protein
MSPKPYFLRHLKCLKISQENLIRNRINFTIRAIMKLVSKNSGTVFFLSLIAEILSSELESLSHSSVLLLIIQSPR